MKRVATSEERRSNRHHAHAVNYDVCVLGGAGHVGAPLALVLADAGLRTLILDLNQAAMDLMASGKMPFREEGGKTLLEKVLKGGELFFSREAEAAGRARIIIITVGTPIDEFHNPNTTLLTRALDDLLPHLRDDQTIVLRSTVAPGTTQYIDNYLRQKSRHPRLAFCPERVVQGKAIEEIRTLPQLISGTSPEALEDARALFSRIAPEVVAVTPLEAEFAKLVCNAYRYIEFAATNQLYMMVESAGVDYQALLEKMKRGYSRMGSIPGPGFAAGPCLMKDTMQLFAFQKHNFILGQVAMTINEGLPNFIVQRLGATISLSKANVGILGMAFKAESDDIRDSLSYKLGKLLRYQGARVYYSDEYVSDPTFVTKEELVRSADAIVVGVPHSAYRTLKVPPETAVVDLWNVLPSRRTA